MSPCYVIKGRRQGFEIRISDEVKECPDGYTEVRREGRVVGVYASQMLNGNEGK